MSIIYDFHIKLYSLRLTVTRRVPIVKQEVSSFPEHMCSHHGSSVGCVAHLYFVFRVLFCGILVVFLPCFFFTIAMSIDLGLTATDYSFINPSSSSASIGLMVEVWIYCYHNFCADFVNSNLKLFKFIYYFLFALLII